MTQPKPIWLDRDALLPFMSGGVTAFVGRLTIEAVPMTDATWTYRLKNNGKRLMDERDAVERALLERDVADVEWAVDAWERAKFADDWTGKIDELLTLCRRLSDCEAWLTRARAALS